MVEVLEHEEAGHADCGNDDEGDEDLQEAAHDAGVYGLAEGDDPLRGKDLDALSQTWG
jgi:hypothetical protein